MEKKLKLVLKNLIILQINVQHYVVQSEPQRIKEHLTVVLFLFF